MPFETTLIPKMDIIKPLWLTLQDLLWLLEDVVQISTRLKLMTSQTIIGLKLPTIHIMISMFCIILIFLPFEIYYSIYNYATVTTEKGAIIIGGYGDGAPIGTVACYKGSGWSRLDDLQSSRSGARAIINGDKVYIIGGAYIQ